MKSKLIAILVIAAVFMAGCTTISKTMKEPANYVEFKKDDFELSAQVSAEATSVRIIGIDFSRLFKKEVGSIEGPGNFVVPVIGSFLTDKTSAYAMYNMMNQYPGYDVIIYPQYDKKKEVPFLIPIFTKTTVKVTARLGKLK